MKRRCNFRLKLIPCPIKKVLGVRCPGCGMTRATLVLMSGDLRKAYKYNPLVFVMVPLMIWGILDVVRKIAAIGQSTNHDVSSETAL